jgi:hypothetical protein
MVLREQKHKLRENDIFLSMLSAANDNGQEGVSMSLTLCEQSIQIQGRRYALSMFPNDITS